MRYIEVTKPGIIFGNIITVSGGFFLGAQGHVNLWLFLATLVGMSLVMAAGCVFNNVIDRDIDKLMQRTQNRVLVKGLISPVNALLYACLLGITGLLLLYFLTNPLTALIALSGLFIYVVIYTLYGKRHSIFGTEIGAIAGAIPPVVGYCAVTGIFNLGALSVFLILLFWQMPHSYAIAIYRFKDYKAASIKVLPVRKGIKITKIHMFIYTCLFTLSALTPTFFGYTGIIYLILALCLGLTWIVIAIKGFKTQDNIAWARKMFVVSILIITLLSVILALSASHLFSI